MGFFLKKCLMLTRAAIIFQKYRKTVNKNIYYFNINATFLMMIPVLLHNIFVEEFFHSKEPHLLYLEIFCNIIKVFTVSLYFWSIYYIYLQNKILFYTFFKYFWTLKFWIVVYNNLPILKMLMLHSKSNWFKKWHMPVSMGMRFLLVPSKPLLSFLWCYW